MKKMDNVELTEVACNGEQHVFIPTRERWMLQLGFPLPLEPFGYYSVSVGVCSVGVERRDRKYGRERGKEK